MILHIFMVDLIFNVFVNEINFAPKAKTIVCMRLNNEFHSIDFKIFVLKLQQIKLKQKYIKFIENKSKVT